MTYGPLYTLPFPRRPESMFDGVEMPVTIILSAPVLQNQLITSRVGRIYTLDFIINYDIKYRMGQDEENDES
jgi:hypothetical protein